MGERPARRQLLGPGGRGEATPWVWTGVGFPGRSFGVVSVDFLREVGRARAFGCARSSAAGCLTSGRVTDRTPCLREKPRTGPGGKPQESWRTRESSSTCVFGEALELRAAGLPESGGRKGMREGVGKPSPRRARKHSGEASKPMRASAFPGFRPRGSTDRRREQRPGVAGHRDLLVLRAG